MLRGKPPVVKNTRLKVFFVGNAKVGKTTAAIHFPKPYFIDAEATLHLPDYVKAINEQEGAVFPCNDIDEVIKEIKTLLTVRHTYKTLVIDSMTVLYDELVEDSINKIKAKTPGSEGTEFGKHIYLAGRKMKHLCNLLLRLDMNVVIISHAKNEYGKDMQVIGQTFDCWKGLAHAFDISLQIEMRNKERIALIFGSRWKEQFPIGDYIPFSYAELAKRFDISMIEKDAEPEVLASSDQVNALKKLIQQTKTDSFSVEKWLSKAQANSFDEMKAADIEKCISFLIVKLSKIYPSVEDNPPDAVEPEAETNGSPSLNLIPFTDKELEMSYLDHKDGF